MVMISICAICGKKTAKINCMICGIPVCESCNVNGICLNCFRGKKIKK